MNTEHARRLAGLLLLAALLAPSAGPAQTPDLAQHFQPRTERYAVEWGGISLGEGTISLAQDEAMCFRYTSTTRPVALVRWTYGAPREASQFCVRDGRVVPLHFEYRNDKRDDESFRLDFDWSDHEVRTLRDGVLTVRKLPEEAYDRFVIREAVRLWAIRHAAGSAPAEAEFTMVDDDRMKTYRFAIGPGETVETPAGVFETVRVERISDPNRPYRYWLAPARGYVPVKIEHLKKGKVELRMTLLP